MIYATLLVMPPQTAAKFHTDSIARPYKGACMVSNGGREARCKLHLHFPVCFTLCRSRFGSAAFANK